jgi:hypothetical protein
MSLGDILTKRDVAEFLQVSERTVEQRMSEGSIPYVYKTGMTSKSLRLGAGKVASALSDDIPFALRQATVFLGVSPQMMSSAEVSEDKRL